MADASVGKIGVDFNNIKNQIGLFANPETIIINTDFLKTLPKKELKAGFAEVVKHALISDINLWEIIKDDFKKLKYGKVLFIQ